MRHWLHNRFTGSGLSQLEVSQTLDTEQDPSPDGVNPGQTTWYDYPGKNLGSYFQGTDSRPSLMARVIPDGTTWYTWYRRDQWGRATNVVTTYSTGYGATPLTRTNVFSFDTNGNLTKAVGPLGETLGAYGYDTNNNLLFSTNAVGDVTSYTYDSQGRRTSSQSPTGLTTTNIYFSSGQYTNWLQTTIDLQIGRTNSFSYTNDLVYTRTDERGLITTNLYDNLQRLTNSSDSRGAMVYVYKNLDLVQVIDRMGFTNGSGYDGVRRKISSTNALGRFTLYNYCTCGSLDSIRDAMGNYTYFYYDNAGRLTNTLFPDGFSKSQVYNLLGQITNMLDTAGTSVTNWFNNQGLTYVVSNSFGQLSALAFDLRDRITNSTDANAVTIATTYDNLGRVLTRTYPDAGVEKFGYVAAGVSAYTNQLGFTNFFAYDAGGRKIFETNANWEITQFGYDPSGNLTNLTDGKLQTTTWKFDQYGRVTNKVDALGTNALIYAYDLDDRLTNRTSAAKGSTAYRFDAVGNLTNVVYPVSPSITLSYDPLDRPTNMVDAVGTTVYSYDSVSQLVGEVGPWADDTVSYTYGNRLRTGLKVLAPNSDPWVQSYAYDVAKRPVAIASAAGSFGYFYDNARHALVAELTLSNGAYITNAYDNVARLLSTQLRNSGGTVLNSHNYAYNQGSQRTWLTNTVGDYRGYAYDKIGQLKTALGSEANGTTRLQEQFGYAYDAADNLNWRTNNGFWENFLANAANELTNVTRSTTNLTVAGTTTSAATNVTVNGSIANLYADATFALAGFGVVNGNNSFTAIAIDAIGRQDTNTVNVNLQASVVYTSDANGNLLSDGTRYFSYDDENQLSSVTVSNAWRSEFVYDGRMRRRVRREYSWVSGAWVKTNEVRYVYDGTLVIQERDGNNLPLITYTRGTDLSGTLQNAGGIGGLLARTDNSLLIAALASAHAYYHADGNGNITALINTNQAIVAKYLYDPFGNLLSKSGSLADANLYRFSSKEIHQNSTLIYYLYRFYDETLQRWPSRDPIGDSASLVYAVDKIGPRLEARSAAERAMMVQQFKDPLAAYTQANLNLSLFVGNNPMGNVDPRGLDWLSCMADCIQAKDPLNSVGKVCLSAVGGTFPKSWWPAGGGVGGGGSPVTTLPSRLGLGAGGGNAARVIGRFFSPIWIGYGLYLAGAEAACAGTCTGDPNTTFPGPVSGFSGGGGTFGGRGGGGTW